MNQRSLTSPGMAGPAAPRRSRLDRRFLGLVAALVALILLNVALTPNFLTIQTLAVNVSQVSAIAIVALGSTLVIITGGIDLSVGSVMALTAVVTAMAMKALSGTALAALPFGVMGASMLLGLGAAALVGLVNGVMIAVSRRR